MNKTGFGLAVIAMLLAGGLFYASNHTNSSQYDAWKAKHGVEFSEAEDQYRRVVFNHNL